jgi:hypothetical protein
MQIGIAFWVVYLLYVVLGFWLSWPNLRGSAPNFVLMILVALLGWRVFGPPING